MARLRSFGLALLLAAACPVLAVGCGQEERAHPANANLNCDGGACVTPPPVGGGGSSGSDGGGSDATADGPGTTSVAGTVVELTGDDFVASIPFTTPSTVSFEGPTGVPVDGSYDGSTFSVTGALVGAAVWAKVTPSTAAAMPTVQVADTESGQSLALAVIPGTTLDLVYALLSVPQTREAGRAHVVLRFIDSTGAPVSGVSVAHGTDVVAYDSGGGWSDLALGSGPLGLAVVANVVTGSSSTKQLFQVTAASGTAGVELSLDPDSVTLADVVVTP